MDTGGTRVHRNRWCKWVEIMITDVLYVILMQFFVIIVVYRLRYVMSSCQCLGIQWILLVFILGAICLFQEHTSGGVFVQYYKLRNVLGYWSICDVFIGTVNAVDAFDPYFVEWE